MGEGRKRGCWIAASAAHTVSCQLQRSRLLLLLALLLLLLPGGHVKIWHTLRIRHAQHAQTNEEATGQAGQQHLLQYTLPANRL